MNSCFCGNPIGDDSILCTRCTALRVLELDSRATKKQIKEAYRVMVKVWHPDRFQGDESVRWSAEQKLKNINLAYRILKETPANTERRSKPARVNVVPQDGPESGSSTSTTGWVPERDNPRILFRWLRWTFRTFAKICVLAFVILIGRYVWIAFDLPELSSGDMHRVYNAGLDNVATELPGPQHRFLEAIKHDLRRLGLNETAAAVATAQQSEDGEQADDAPQTDPSPNDKPSQKQSGKTKATPRVIHSYITVGSTRDEVLALQGPPTTSSEDKLVYGRSELDMKDGAVVGWRIDRASNPIRVKLWPEHSVDTSQTFFTVDSTRDDVLVVQGTPTAFAKDEFDYGGSAIYFRNNRVASWRNDPSSIPLRARNP